MTVARSWSLHSGRTNWSTGMAKVRWDDRSDSDASSSSWQATRVVEPSFRSARL